MASAPFNRHYCRYDRAVHPLNEAQNSVQKSEATSTLIDGVSPDALLLGFIIADGALCMVSPSLLFTIYARKFGLRFAAASLPKGSLLRIAGALLIAVALYEFDIPEDTQLIGQIVSFAVLGLACQLLGWNRLVLLVACLLGPLLEENVRRAMIIAGGEPAYLLSRPIGATMLLLAIAIFIFAVALSTWRTIWQPRLGGIMREAKPVESK